MLAYGRAYLFLLKFEDAFLPRMSMISYKFTCSLSKQMNFPGGNPKRRSKVCPQFVSIRSLNLQAVSVFLFLVLSILLPNKAGTDPVFGTGLR